MPVFIDIAPLWPLAPLSALRIENAPLLLLKPYPAIIEISPPVNDVLSPLDTVTRPPAALSPLPTTTLRLPLVPEVADPVRRTTEPLLPSLLVPVLRDTEPLTPSTPACSVRNVKEPLDVTLP